MRHALLFLLLILSARPARADKLDEALGLMWSGKIEQGLKAVRSLAEQGNVRAQLFLGHAYANENTLVKHSDYQQAMKWFKMASSQGSGEASAGIAELYEQGHGVPKSPKNAKAWWDLAAKQSYDQQELDVRCFVHKPGANRLTCQPEDIRGPCPTPSEMATLGPSGLTGTLRPTGGGLRYRLGPKARVVIVLDHRITSEVRLKQPRHTSIIYVQHETGWSRLPENAPLLDRPIVLSPQLGAAQYTLVGVQDVDGSTTSSGCATWK